ncbi:hypothetical protein [Kitasatospora indigofera]
MSLPGQMVQQAGVSALADVGFRAAQGTPVADTGAALAQGAVGALGGRHGAVRVGAAPKGLAEALARLPGAGEDSGRFDAFEALPDSGAGFDLMDGLRLEVTSGGAQWARPREVGTGSGAKVSAFASAVRGMGAGGDGLPWLVVGTPDTLPGSTVRQLESVWSQIRQAPQGTGGLPREIVLATPVTVHEMPALQAFVATHGVSVAATIPDLRRTTGTWTHLTPTDTTGTVHRATVPALTAGDDSPDAVSSHAATSLTGMAVDERETRPRPAGAPLPAQSIAAGGIASVPEIHDRTTGMGVGSAPARAVAAIPDTIGPVGGAWVQRMEEAPGAVSHGHGEEVAAAAGVDGDFGLDAAGVVGDVPTVPGVREGTGVRVEGDPSPGTFRMVAVVGEAPAMGTVAGPPRWERVLPSPGEGLSASPGVLPGGTVAVRIPAGILLHGIGPHHGLVTTAHSLTPDPDRLTIVAPDPAGIRALHTLIDALPASARQRLRLVIPDRGLAHATSLLNSLPNIHEVLIASGARTEGDQWLSISRTPDPNRQGDLARPATVAQSSSTPRSLKPVSTGVGESSAWPDARHAESRLGKLTQETRTGLLNQARDLLEESVDGTPRVDTVTPEDLLRVAHVLHRQGTDRARTLAVELTTELGKWKPGAGGGPSDRSAGMPQGQQTHPGPPTDELSADLYIQASGIVSQHGWLPMPGSRQSTPTLREIQRHVHEEVARTLAMFGEPAAQTRARDLTRKYRFEPPRGLAAGARITLRIGDLSDQARDRLRDEIREVAATSPTGTNLYQIGKKAVTKLRQEGIIPDSIPGNVHTKYVRYALGHNLDLQSLPNATVNWIRERYLELRASGIPRTAAAAQVVTASKIHRKIPTNSTSIRISATSSKKWDDDAERADGGGPLRDVRPNRHLRITDLPLDAQDRLDQRIQELDSMLSGSVSIHRLGTLAIAQLRKEKIISDNFPGSVIQNSHLQRVLGAFIRLHDLRSDVVEQLRDRYLALRSAKVRQTVAAERAVTELRNEEVIPIGVRGTIIPLSYGFRWERQLSGAAEPEMSPRSQHQLGVEHDWLELDLSREEVADLDGFMSDVTIDLDELLGRSSLARSDGQAFTHGNPSPGPGHEADDWSSVAAESENIVLFEMDSPGQTPDVGTPSVEPRVVAEELNGHGLPDGVTDFSTVHFSLDDLAFLDTLLGGVTTELNEVTATAGGPRSEKNAHSNGAPSPDSSSGPEPDGRWDGSTLAGEGALPFEASFSSALGGRGVLPSVGGSGPSGWGAGGLLPLPLPAQRWQVVASALSTGMLSWEVVAAAQVQGSVFARIPTWAGLDAVVTLRAWQAAGLPVFGSSIPSGRIEGEQVLVVFPPGAGYDLGTIERGMPDGVLVVPAINSQLHVIGVIANQPEPGTTTIVLATAPHMPLPTNWPSTFRHDAPGDNAAAGAHTKQLTHPAAQPTDRPTTSGRETEVSDVVPPDRQLQHTLGGWLDLSNLPPTALQQARWHYLSLRNDGIGERDAASLTVTELKRNEVIPAITDGTTLPLSVVREWERTVPAETPANPAETVNPSPRQATALPSEGRQHLDDRIRTLAARHDGMSAFRIGKEAVAQLKSEGILRQSVPDTLPAGYVQRALGHIVDLKSLSDPVVEKIRGRYLALREEGIPQKLAVTQAVTEMRNERIIPDEAIGNAIRKATAVRWERTYGTGNGQAQPIRRTSRLAAHPYLLPSGLPAQMQGRPDVPRGPSTTGPTL